MVSSTHQYRIVLPDDLPAYISDGIALTQSFGETRFIGNILYKDVWENGELMKTLLTAHLDKKSSHHSSSEFAFDFDYTQVPSRMRVFPISDLRGVSAEWDIIIEGCLRSEGKLMVAKVSVQRGSRTGTLVYSFLTERMAV